MGCFFVDESLPPQLAEALRQAGDDATHVQDRRLSGIDDDSVYRVAAEGGFVLISQDLDFSDVRRFHGDVGLVIVRFRHRLTRDELVRLCLTAIESRSTEIETLGSNVMILEAGRGRIRRKSP